MPSCSRLLPGTVLALTLLGCGGKVVVDGTGTPAAAVNALVVKDPDPNGACLIQADTDPPGAVFLLVTSQPINCAQAEMPLLGCPEETAGPAFQWEMCIPLQPEIAPAKIDFTAYTPDVQLGSVGADCMNEEYATVPKGIVTITAVAPTSITVTLSGTNQPPVGGGAVITTGTVLSDGTYEAPRCP